MILMNMIPTQINIYKATTNKIRCNAFMSNPSEEQKWLAEHIKQIENKRYLEYQHTQRIDQTILKPSSFKYTHWQPKTRKI